MRHFKRRRRFLQLHYFRGPAVCTRVDHPLAARLDTSRSCFVAGIFSIYAMPDDLLDERYKPPLQKGQHLIDKVTLISFLLPFTATVILIPVDAFRVHFLPPPGLIPAFSGLLLFAAGWSILARAFVENSYAAPVVKLQTERGQHLIDTGPYRIVRHPMYSGFLPTRHDSMARLLRQHNSCPHPNLPSGAAHPL